MICRRGSRLVCRRHDRCAAPNLGGPRRKLAEVWAAGRRLLSGADRLPLPAAHWVGLVGVFTANASRLLLQALTATARVPTGARGRHARLDVVMACRGRRLEGQATVTLTVNVCRRPSML